MIKPFVLLVYCQLLPLLVRPSLEVPPAAVRATQSGKEIAVAIYTAYENPFLLYVRMDNPGRRPVSFSLLTEHNEKLYAWRTSSNKYNLRLDLSNLKNGSYRMRVAGPTTTFVRTLHISTLYQQQTRRVVSLNDPEFVQVRY
jgi:hypothetical protein